ncbi:hypothetical protein [Synechococcus sp. CS-1332]|uniref:hypothetical protein n=1 Tax=Synechococcus sp. CS-1332 TaxID=2847972 RepID=UPI00223C1BE6|nr:hypothetical protein [Synechococcus sp. CS-1332]
MEVEGQLDADGILEGQHAVGAGMVRAAAHFEHIKTRRTWGALSMFHPLRWRSRVAGDNLATWMLRQGRDEGRWARGYAIASYRSCGGYGQMQWSASPSVIKMFTGATV